MNTLEKLIGAEQKAALLFEQIQAQQLIVPGKTEKDLNTEIYALAMDMFGIEKYWHKRIVRAGTNTLLPYAENPPNRIIEPDDIVFLDFGPVFEDWEADFGRTYVLGDDPEKHAITADAAALWERCRDYYFEQPDISGAAYFKAIVQIAETQGWIFGGPIGGHLIGHFPHEKLDKEDKRNYIHPQNEQSMMAPDQNGNKRAWILEIHLINQAKTFGAFYEQLLV